MAREITVAAPSQKVFDYIRIVKNQEQYSTWVMQDPAMKKVLTGTDGTVGFIYAWDSEKAGKGEQEITSITEGEGIGMEIRFEKPLEGIAHTTMSTEPIDDGHTKVKWAMEGRNNYPINFMNLFMGSMLGNDMDASLQLLKSNLEK